MRRLALVSMSLLVFGSALSLTSSSPVGAWVNTYEPADGCTVLSRMPFDAFFATATSNGIFTMAGFLNHYTLTGGSGNVAYQHDMANPDHSMIIISTGNSPVTNGDNIGTVYFEANATDQIKLTGNGTTVNSLYLPIGTRSATVTYAIAGNPGVADPDRWYFNSPTAASVATQSITSASAVSCIQKVNNIVYDTPNYTGPTYTGFTEDEYEGSGNVSCSALNVGCQINKVFTGVANTFIEVGKAIVKGIAALFMPDGDRMADLFDELKTAFLDQLGFLAFPFTYVYDIGEATIASSTGDFNCDIPGNCVAAFDGEMLGGEVSLDFGAMRQGMSGYYALVQNILRATTIFALVVAFYHKYRGMMQS